MPRFFWISASIAALVAAFALLALAVPGIEQMDARPAAEAARLRTDMRVVTYQVPPERSDVISSTLSAVLLGTRDGVQPLGQARVAAPGRLMVSAPASMHESIRQAIEELSQGQQVTGTTQAATAVEVWLVEAQESPGADDARLVTVKPMLDEARKRFGHGHYALLDRGMVVAMLDSSQAGITGSRFRAHLQARPQGKQMAQVQINLDIPDAPVVSRSFGSTLPLPDGQWQLVGLMPGSGESAPERLLLMRQTPVKPAPTQGQ